ncbi:MAG: HYExAFE family protein [Planctomycetales bacterium]|nr:HYExAFE family protein [Planctomycetales bacterium]
MTKRCNHYELAFETYLREHRVAYVAVNEQRRSLTHQGSLKSLDFIVSLSDTASLLIDIKGRRFPSGGQHKQYWKNWSRWDDLSSMACWQDRLGCSSCALLVFAYQVVGDRSPVEAERLFAFRDRWYAFLAVRVADYIQFSKPLSARWQTVSMPAQLFRQAAIPFDSIVGWQNRSLLGDKLAGAVDLPVGMPAPAN